MILTKHFVYIHFPRAGGMFMRKILEDFAPADWEIQKIEEHRPISRIPKTHRHLPKIGIVRNPYDWYVSWYAFEKHYQKTPIFIEKSDQGRKPFKETIHAILDYDFGDLMHTDTDGLFEPTCYSVYFNFMYGPGANDIELGRFERLREELLRILQKVAPVSPELADGVRQTAPVNTRPHAHYRDYYDDELRQRIAELDGDLMKEFGYAF